MPFRFHLTRLFHPDVCVLVMLAFLLCVLTGCGGTTSSALTRGPVISGPTITKTAATLLVTSETVNAQVAIVSNTALNVSTSPPTINFVDPNNKSLIGGPQPLTSLSSDPTAWAYQFSVPASAVSQTYTVIINAQDSFGNKGNTPYTAGTITLP